MFAVDIIVHMSELNVKLYQFMNINTFNTIGPFGIKSLSFHKVQVAIVSSFLPEGEIIDNIMMEWSPLKLVVISH